MKAKSCSIIQELNFFKLIKTFVLINKCLVYAFLDSNSFSIRMKSDIHARSLLNSNYKLRHISNIGNVHILLMSGQQIKIYLPFIEEQVIFF